MKTACAPYARSCGFVLLTTLVLLALVSVVLSDVARRSVRAAGAASLAERDLQRRWGAAFAQQTLLRRPAARLEAQARDGGGPRHALRTRIDLGGMRFTIVLADEQAKVNLNRLYADRGLSAVSRTAGRFTRGQVDVALQPRIRPGRMRQRMREAKRNRRDANTSPRAGGAPPAADAKLGSDADASGDAEEATGTERLLPPPPRAFASWNEVFASPSPARLLGFPRRGRRPIGRLTLWGDGRINLRRASEPAAQAALGHLLSRREIAAMLEAARQLPARRFDEPKAARRRNARSRKRRPPPPENSRGRRSEGARDASDPRAARARLESLLPAAVRSNPEQTRAVLSRIGLRSDCFSVTIIVRDGSRVDYRMAVRTQRRDDEGPARSPRSLRRRYHQFSW